MGQHSLAWGQLWPGPDSSQALKEGQGHQDLSCPGECELSFLLPGQGRGGVHLSSSAPREEAAQEGAEHSSALLSHSRAGALGAVPPPQKAWCCALGVSGCTQAPLSPAPCSWAGVWEQAAALTLSQSPHPCPSLPPVLTAGSDTQHLSSNACIGPVGPKVLSWQPSGCRSSLPAELPFNKRLWRSVPGGVGVLVPRAACCTTSLCPGALQALVHRPPWAHLQTLRTQSGKGEAPRRVQACLDSLSLALRQPRDCPSPRGAGGCPSVLPLLGGGSDLAERREVQRRQGTVEHVSHCSQQLEAGEHLVKEVREGLLQGEGQ